MYIRNMKKYQSMNLVYTTPEGYEIWLGDYYAATNLNLLKQKKITSVLTAAAMLDIKYPKEAGIKHKILNAYDIPTYKMTKHFDEAYKFIKQSLSTSNILVHCAAGISRSTTCVLVYLMRERGLGFKESLQMVRVKRSIVNPNPGFQNQLSRYQLTLKKGDKDVTKQDQEKYVKGQTKERLIEQVEEEKDAFIKFMSKEETWKLNKTTGKSNFKGEVYNTRKIVEEPISNRNRNEERNKNMRGQSLNYRREAGGKGVTMHSNINKMNNIMFKLEQPKIVTIKK